MGVPQQEPVEFDGHQVVILPAALYADIVREYRALEAERDDLRAALGRIRDRAGVCEITNAGSGGYARIRAAARAALGTAPPADGATNG